MTNQINRLIALALTLISLTAVAATAEAGAPSLRSKYSSFQASERRETAREIVAYSQQRGLAAASLEKGLRQMGFGSREIVQAVVESANGSRHNVALWFEDRNDPWVLDPSGAAATQMTRLSALGQWTPVALASNTASFRLQGGRVQPNPQLSQR